MIRKFFKKWFGLLTTSVKKLPRSKNSISALISTLRQTYPNVQSSLGVLVKGSIEFFPMLHFPLSSLFVVLEVANFSIQVWQSPNVRRIVISSTLISLHVTSIISAVTASEGGVPNTSWQHFKYSDAAIMFRLGGKVYPPFIRGCDTTLKALLDYDFFNINETITIEKMNNAFLKEQALERSRRALNLETLNMIYHKGLVDYPDRTGKPYLKPYEKVALGREFTDYGFCKSDRANFKRMLQEAYDPSISDRQIELLIAKFRSKIVVGKKTIVKKGSVKKVQEIEVLDENGLIKFDPKLE